MFLGKKPKPVYDKIVLNHVIFLTEEQRYSLYEYDDVITTGFLIQYRIKKGKYDVKHDEIICQYVISTYQEEEIVQVFPNHYKINLPVNESHLPANNTTVDSHDIINKKDGGRESIFFEAIYTDVEKRMQGYHKVEIKDMKMFTKSLSFLKI